MSDDLATYRAVARGAEQLRLTSDAITAQCLLESAHAIRALCDRVERAEAERDRQYEFNVEQIAKHAALEAENAALRELLREAAGPLRAACQGSMCCPDGCIADKVAALAAPKGGDRE